MHQEFDDFPIDISIIIPIRDRSDTLNKTLHSILEANCPKNIQYEILVIHCNKGENCFIEDCHIRYLDGRDVGASNLRNLGIKEARGNILMFTDDCSLVDRNWIMAYWQLFKNAEIQIAQGRVLLQGESAKIPSWVEKENCYSRSFFDPDGEPAHVETLLACNMAARKRIFELYGGFSPYLGPGTAAELGENIELASRLRAFGLAIFYQPKALVYNARKEDFETKEYWEKKQYESGYAAAIISILVNWEKPRRARQLIEFLKCRLTHIWSTLMRDEPRRLKCDGKTAFCRGALAGIREAMRQRRRFCAKKQTLTVCIITQDSAHCIERILKSVESICDEIILIDGGSRDKTADIAKSFKKVRYYLRPWPGNYIEQKNWAFNKATGDWVLSMDTDELVGKNIREKISQYMKSDKHNSYTFPRYWLVSDSPLLYVAARKLYPDYQQRLFRNIPKHRYTADRSIHHKFPKGLQGRGKKAKDSHIFHFAFLYRDRSERERIVRTRKKMELITDRINRSQYLYEERPHRIMPCKEELEIPPPAGC